MLKVYAEALDRQMDLAVHWLSPVGYAELSAFHRAMEESPQLVDIGQQLFGPPLRAGECFYWAAHICDLVYTASQSIPSNWALMINALPAPCGFFWLAKPVPYGEAWVEEAKAQGVSPDIGGIRAISWVPLVTDSHGLAVLEPPYETLPSFRLYDDKIGVSFYVEHPNLYSLPAPVTNVLYPLGATLAEVGQAAARYDGTELRDKTLADFKANLFASMIAFLQQRILVPSRQQAPRSTRRRAEKEYRHEPTINVVKLREIMRRQHEGEGHAVEWNCQWVVSGHWRDQWFPSIRRNQPIWIAPHIKGPDGKPLRHPERLFAVVR